MNRNDFGFFGADLSNEEFSQALAAAGIVGENAAHLGNNLTEDDIAQKILILLKKNNLLKWSPTAYWFNHELQDLTSAKVFANAWKIVIKSYGDNVNSINYLENNNQIRLEIDDKFSSYSEKTWYYEQLSHSEVGVTSIYFNSPQMETKISWDYPVRVGFLNDSVSQQFRYDIQDLNFFGEPLSDLHIKIVELNKENSNCDILLLPHNLKNAVANLLESSNTLSANLVLVTGNIDELNNSFNPLIEILRTQTRSAGVCLSPVVPMEIEESSLATHQIWFKELIREISHNNPIDVALFRASRNINVKSLPPLIFASNELIKSSQISNRIEKFRKQISNEKVRDYEMKISDNMIEEQVVRNNNLESNKESYSFNDISNGLKKSAENFDWSGERRMASSFSRLKKITEEILESSAKLHPPMRWIQTEIWEFDKQKQEEKRSAKNDSGLIADTNYLINVFIGEKSTESIEADKPFNEKDLNPSENEHQLTVFFTESNISPKPKIAKITLPRKGNSNSCDFFVYIPKSINKISARIIISYKNRILQTALLEADVFENRKASSESSKEKKISLLVEGVIRSSFQNLTERKWFDAAFILNHNQSGISQVTKLIGENAELISVDGITDIIKWFDNKITEVAKYWEKYETLESKKSQDLLRECARNGVALYKALIAGRDEGVLAFAERIQIVSAKYGSRLPLEFVYGKRNPKENAPLCENAQKALAEGKCSDSCPKGIYEKNVICPLGFWGLSKVIERHAYDAKVLKQMPNADFALQSDPVGVRKRLNILTNALLACSNNVDAVDSGTTKKVIEMLDKVTNHQSKMVKSWDEWIEEIDKQSPSLLVLLPHTLKNVSTGGTKMEISANEQLDFSDIEKEYILGPKGEPQPVVILMGCKTGSPDIAYENFIHEFRRLGAALIVGTGSTILGRHAAPVTNAFIDSIAEIKTSNVAFGDIMLKVRRQMVSKGLLMSFCLTSYGDTDWLI